MQARCVNKVELKSAQRFSGSPKLKQIPQRTQHIRPPSTEAPGRFEEHSDPGDREARGQAEEGRALRLSVRVVGLHKNWVGRVVRTQGGLLVSFGHAYFRHPIPPPPHVHAPTSQYEKSLFPKFSTPSFPTQVLYPSCQSKFSTQMFQLFQCVPRSPSSPPKISTQIP